MNKHESSNTSKQSFSMSIRQYRPNDLGELMDVWENANRVAHPFLDEAYVAKVKQDIPALYMPNSDTWVATSKKRVIGFISLMGNEIGALFVSPEYHGRGVGTALTDQARRLHGNLEVEVFEANSLGRSFYRHYRFVASSKSLHEPTGETVIHLKYASATHPSCEATELGK